MKTASKDESEPECNNNYYKINKLINKIMTVDLTLQCAITCNGIIFTDTLSHPRHINGSGVMLLTVGEGGPARPQRLTILTLVL